MTSVESSGRGGGATTGKGRVGNVQPSRRGASSTVEDYLKCILLHQPGTGGGDEATGSDREQTVSMGTLSAALEVAPGTVTAMMKALGESGLVDYLPYAGVKLTESGRHLATHVIRRHRLIELFLVEIMQLDWSEVHAEAELLEHAVSDRLIERMDEMLGFPSTDPHGDPIPTSDGKVEEQPLPNLMQCAERTPMLVVRVLDQSADFLRRLERDGVVPGERVEVIRRSESGLDLAVGEGTVQLEVDVATKVFVEVRA